MISGFDGYLELLLLDYFKGNLVGNGKIMVRACLELREDVRQTYCLMMQLAGYFLQEIQPVETIGLAAMRNRIMSEPPLDNITSLNDAAARRNPANEDDIFPPVIQRSFNCTSDSISWRKVAPGLATAGTMRAATSGMQLWKIEPSCYLQGAMAANTACLVIDGELWARHKNGQDRLLVTGDLCLSAENDEISIASDCKGPAIALTCELRGPSGEMAQKPDCASRKCASPKKNGLA